jgi:uncharacterized membrane protein
MKKLLAAVVVLSLAGLTGCNEPKTGSGGNPAKGGGTFTINEKNPGKTVDVTQGDKVDVTLTITRKNNFAGDVDVDAKLAKGPDGVPQADVPKQLKLNLVPTTFPGNKQDATVDLQVTAAPDAKLGDYGIRITGTPKGGEKATGSPMELKVHVKASDASKAPGTKAK